MFLLEACLGYLPDAQKSDALVYFEELKSIYKNVNLEIFSGFCEGT